MIIYFDPNDVHINEHYLTYVKLVENAKNRVPQGTKRKVAKSILGYCEHHHIVPRCLNGSNDATNMIWLTAFEHLQAHILLYKFAKSIRMERKMSLSVVRMLNKQDKNHKRVYEEDLSEEYLLEIATIRERAAKTHSEFMSEKNKGSNNPFYGKKCPEHVKELSRVYWKNNKRTDENKENCRLSKLGDLNPSTVIVTCPHCGKTGKAGGMRKSHFEHCIDYQVFTFYNTNNDLVFIGTKDQFINELKLAKWAIGGVGNLLRGKSPTFREWILLE